MAINDMLLKTSTLTAPWTIVEGDCKWYARVKTLRTLVDVLSEDLDFVPPDPVAKSAPPEEEAEKPKAKKGKKTEVRSRRGRRQEKEKKEVTLGRLY